MDLIEMFGNIVDKFLKENDIALLIHIPENSMDVEIKSNLEIEVMQFYIMLHALEKLIKFFVDREMIDDEKKEDFIDAILQLIKTDLMREVEE